MEPNEVTLAHELQKRGLRVRRQVPISIEFDGLKFDEGSDRRDQRRKLIENVRAEPQRPQSEGREDLWPENMGRQGSSRA